jgi:hypothetical protein
VLLQQTLCETIKPAGQPSRLFCWALRRHRKQEFVLIQRIMHATTVRTFPAAPGKVTPIRQIINGKSMNSRLRNTSTTIRVLYAVCLAGAAYNHARILFAHGLWWNYGGIHPFYAGFWTSLTFLDFLAVVLLLACPRPGLVLTTSLIVSDVLINACVGLTYGFDWPAFGAQFVFMAIVLATVRPAWRGCGLGEPVPAMNS